MINKTEWQSAIDGACLAIKRSIGRALALTGYRESWMLRLQISRREGRRDCITRRFTLSPGVEWLSTQQLYDQINAQSTHNDCRRLPNNLITPENTLIVKSVRVKSGWWLERSAA